MQQITIFQANDKTIFYSEKECRKYELGLLSKNLSDRIYQSMVKIEDIDADLSPEIISQVLNHIANTSFNPDIIHFLETHTLVEDIYEQNI